MSEDSEYKLCHNCGAVVLRRPCPICGNSVEDWPNTFIEAGNPTRGNQIRRHQKLPDNQ
jgi:hypothetical protein